MKTHYCLTQSRQWLWVLFLACSLLIGALVYQAVDSPATDPYAELPAIADPLFGSGGGSG